jgi:mRNA interferase MazF
MKVGDLILTPLPQADGRIKNRPAIVLREMPPFNDLLVCGISTQLHLRVKGFDEVITQMDSDFASSGLVSDSLIRLGFLAVLPSKDIVGSIGQISSKRHERLLKTLSDYLIANRGEV